MPALCSCHAIHMYACAMTSQSSRPIYANPCPRYAHLVQRFDNPKPTLKAMLLPHTHSLPTVCLLYSCHASHTHMLTTSWAAFGQNSPSPLCVPNICPAATPSMLALGSPHVCPMPSLCLRWARPMPAHVLSENKTTPKCTNTGPSRSLNESQYD